MTLRSGDPALAEKVELPKDRTVQNIRHAVAPGICAHPSVQNERRREVHCCAFFVDMLSPHMFHACMLPPFDIFLQANADIANFISLAATTKAVFAPSDATPSRQVFPQLAVDPDTTTILTEYVSGHVYVTIEGAAYLRDNDLNIAATEHTYQRRAVGHIAIPAGDWSVLAHVPRRTCSFSRMYACRDPLSTRRAQQQTFPSYMQLTHTDTRAVHIWIGSGCQARRVACIFPGWSSTRLSSTH